MKYIIDIPDRNVVTLSPNEKRLKIPINISTGNNIGNKQKISLSTDFILKPYSELNREAIEDEVWEFATTCTKMDGADSVDVFGGFSLDSFTKYSYQEAKAKYEAWKKSKEEIHVGDEVKCWGFDGVVVGIDTASEDSGVNVVCRDGSTGYIGMAYVTKTGRHFTEVEDLLKKMRGEQDE